MNKSKLAAFLPAFAATVASAYKVTVLSDLHILPIYNPNVNNTCYCSTGCGGQQSINPDVASGDYAPLGRIYCDPPQTLIEAFI